MLSSDELEPAPEAPSLELLPAADPALALEPVAVIRLNGGLATTMGLSQPKSLMEARDGRSFLSIIIGQTLALRRRYGARLPLVLMDSEATQEATLRELARHPELALDGIAPDFLQSMIPKLDADTLEPVQLARGARARVVPTGSRRRLRRAAALGHARRAARAGLSLRDDLQLRQPRGEGRRADRRAHGRRRDPVPDGGRPRHRGGSQGGPRRPPASRRQARVARDRPDPARRRGFIPGFPPLALLQQQHAVGRPRRHWPTRSRASTGSSSCR